MRQQKAGVVPAAVLALFATHGAVADTATTPYRIGAIGATFLDTNVPGGTVRDAVHSSRIADTEADTGLALAFVAGKPLEVGRGGPGSIVVEAEFGLGYHRMESQGVWRSGLCLPPAQSAGPGQGPVPTLRPA